MKEKPIIFTGESVRAILEGRKTQTRRVVKLTTNGLADLPNGRASHLQDGVGLTWIPFGGSPILPMPSGRYEDFCPWYPGQRLWVKETYRILETGMNNGKPDYKADDPSACGEGFIPFKSPLFMKRAHSRLMLEVTAVRVERLQGISEEDASAEGIGGIRDMQFAVALGNINAGACRLNFIDHWDKINGKKYSWKDNPWVWVIEFKRI